MSKEDLERLKREHAAWVELSREMAIHAIAIELADLMVPYSEGMERAKRILDNKQQDALNMEHNMGLALMVLKKLNYKVISNQRQQPPIQPDKPSPSQDQ